MHTPPASALSRKAILHASSKTKLSSKMTEGVLVLDVHILVPINIVVIVEGVTIGAVMVTARAKKHVKGV